jgi:hypothetical protein
MKTIIINIIKKLFLPIYYKFKIAYTKIMCMFFKPDNKIDDFRNIPIIINNRNRLTYLKMLVDALEKRGYKNIYIIDNASTYQPLLDYYQNLKYKIFYLKKNAGFLALWKTKIYKLFIRDFYVYTDSDVVPIDECPDDFLAVFKKAMEHEKELYKVGFSLKIDDLPDYYLDKYKVIKWESKFHKNKISDLFYRATIDTTFALYHPWYKGGARNRIKMYRSAYPYEARHLPWYIDSTDISYEDRYYIIHASQPTHWSNSFKK